MFKWFKKKFFNKNNQTKYQFGLKKTKSHFTDFQTILKTSSNIEESLLQALENLFIKADVGVPTTIYLMQAIKTSLQEQKIDDPQKLPQIIIEIILDLYQTSVIPANPKFQEDDFQILLKKPQIYLFVGVNGVGKTTTIGKLSFKFNKKEQKTLLIAGDTFRAGAKEQLKIWGTKTKSQVFLSSDKKSASSVIFEGLQMAQKNNYDIVLCDTSGRLQNKTNLMQELAKINRVIKKHYPLNSLQTFLVLDATIGQNALNQVAIFNESTPLKGVILTKLDGTSKGGTILAIKHLYQLQTQYIGVGEKPEDLILFDIKDYLFSLFEDFFPTI